MAGERVPSDSRGKRRNTVTRFQKHRAFKKCKYLQQNREKRMSESSFNRLLDIHQYTANNQVRSGSVQRTPLGELIHHTYLCFLFFSFPAFFRRTGLSHLR